LPFSWRLFGRPGQRASNLPTLAKLPPDHEAWAVVGGYLGQLAATITLMLSVERIIFGGGVMANGFVLPHIRNAFSASLNGYLQPLGDAESAANYITGPSLGDRAGIVGALLLAESVGLNFCRPLGALT
jgi:fructokinase